MCVSVEAAATASSTACVRIRGVSEPCIARPAARLPLPRLLRRDSLAGPAKMSCWAAGGWSREERALWAERAPLSVPSNTREDAYLCPARSFAAITSLSRRAAGGPSGRIAAGPSIPWALDAGRSWTPSCRCGIWAAPLSPDAQFIRTDSGVAVMILLAGGRRQQPIGTQLTNAAEHGTGTVVFWPSPPFMTLESDCYSPEFSRQNAAPAVSSAAPGILGDGGLWAPSVCWHAT